MRKLIFLMPLLSACAGGPSGGTTGGNCGTAEAACTSSAQCCSGFACAGGVCVFQESGVGSGGNSAAASTGSQCTAGHCTTSSNSASGAGGNPSSSGGHQSSSAGSGGHTSTTGSSSSSGSTSAGHGSSTSSNSSSTGGTTGVCSSATTVDATEFLICGTGQAACDSPLRCVSDPPFNVTDCEYPCQVTDDCPDPTTICSGGNCVNNLCGPIGAGGSIVNSAFDAACNATGSKDGVCLAFLISDAGVELGLCLQAGEPVGSCNGGFVPRCVGSSSFCTGGFVCGSFVNTSLPSTCVEACNPSAATTCPGGTACTATGDGYTGTCAPASTGGSSTGGTSGGTGGGGLCTACTQDSNCTGYCVLDGDGSSTYCAPDCSLGQSCPAADPCAQGTDADGFTNVTTCYPSSGSCDG